MAGPTDRARTGWLFVAAQVVLLVALVALPTGTVLARLELRALTDAPAEIAVRSAAAAGPDGARLTVSADGTLVEPEPWQPATRLWLPWLDRADRLR